MAKLEGENTLQRFRNRYRLVVMNDDTYEEVVTFRLSRMSVYIAFSTIFVFLIGLTVALIVFTPLKYYIPFYKPCFANNYLGIANNTSFNNPIYAQVAVAAYITS